MNRRQALRAGGAIGLACLSGCLGLLGSSTDDSPIEADPETLLLSKDELYGEWTEEHPDPDIRGFRDNPLLPMYPKPTTFDDADETAYYYPTVGDGILDPSEGFVGSAVWLYDDADDAIGAYDALPFHEGHGFEDVGVAAESIGGFPDDHESRIHIFFRDANVVGGITYVNYVDQGDGDIDRIEQDGIELAETMHDGWRD